jgi:hypothetical protein
MPASGWKVHWVDPARNRTLCGRVAIRYDSAGGMLSWLHATRDPCEVTCLPCRTNPFLYPVK